ncbi:MAG: M14 family metallopeptidase [Desulfobacterales bacterium]|nr:M14 family metallopeptidase [Desulfobacterales bacterium]
MTTRTIETHPLPAASMANTRTLTILRYGARGNRPKVHIQAGLHADEAPGYLVMHHLIETLDRIDAGGGIAGEIVLIPAANPIGVSQWRDDWLQGRFNFSDGVNFNRSYPDLAATVADSVQDRLGEDADVNIGLIREAFGRALDEIQPADEAAHLKRKLMRAAHDADIVLDLHCDGQAVMHVYIGTSLWPEARDLSAWLGAAATLLSDDSGVMPFDEACSRIWWRLAARFPDHPVPPACLAATVELRGLADLSHAMAAEDAGNILRFLTGRGLIRGQTESVDPPPLKHQATPLSAVEHVKAPAPGVVVFRKQPGETITAGDVVAEVVNPLPSNTAQRIHPIRAAAEGLLFARSADRFARPGRILAKIAGRKPLKGQGENLLTP